MHFDRFEITEELVGQDKIPVNITGADRNTHCKLLCGTNYLMCQAGYPFTQSGKLVPAPRVGFGQNVRQTKKKSLTWDLFYFLRVVQATVQIFI